MKMRRISLILSGLLLAALFLGGCVSLAGDITPPPNYRPPTEPPQQQVDLQTLFPILPPDPAQGAAIYAQKCQPCHGETGKGDGPQAAQLPNPPAPLGNPDFARKALPVQWYQTVTDGALDKFMPGFSGSLDDRQRWDVVAYALTLSTTQDELSQGKELYDANCAACHGLTGKGDGEKAAGLKTKPASWADQEKLAGLSADTLVSVTQQGKGEMPAFQDKLTVDQSYAVADYIRQLSFAAPGQPAQVASANTPAASTPASGTPAAGTPAGTAVAEKPIVISGKVTNGTPGGKLPDGLKVKLSAYEQMTPAFDKTVDVSADGTYRFQDVAYNTNYVYFVTVDANGLTFNSNILHATDVQGSVADLPVSIYESTTDASALRTQRLHIFFDFTNPGVVQVINLYIIDNPTQKVVVAPEQGKPVITFELPQGATNLQFQDGSIGDRYVQTSNGFGDTAAVQPGTEGQNQILFAYNMPYTNSLSYTMKVPLPVDAATVLVPPGGVSIKSSQLVDAGQQDVQGMSFQMFQASSPLNAGDTLSLTLSGQPGQAAAGSGNPQQLYLLIGLGVFGLVLIGAGIWMYVQRARQTAAAMGEAVLVSSGEADESSEALLDAIVALDDQHASGGLAEDAYQKLRAGLKTRLADALAREKGG